MKITVLTPTFNRAKLLNRLYTSLIVNYNYNVQIEWIIMNDGSTDDTKKVVQEFIEQNIIDIKYFEQENKGKMSAINTLIKYCTGDVIIECDSDDYFTNNALN